jgi:hypothetical protein
MVTIPKELMEKIISILTQIPYGQIAPLMQEIQEALKDKQPKKAS